MPLRPALAPLRAALTALALLAAAPARAEGSPDDQLAAARAHAAAGRWAEAAAAARDVAFHHPHTEAGRGAAIVYLEGVDGVASRGPTSRPEAYDALEADVPALVRLHCHQGDVVAHPEPCLPLLRVQRDLARLSDAGPGRGLEQYERRAEADLVLWNVAGKRLCLAKHPDCKGMEHVLYDAARAFRTAKRVSRATGVRRTLTDPRYGLHTTEPAQRAMFEVAEDFETHYTFFDMAAEWYERVAREAPTMDKAPAALERAVGLRLLLGEDAQAERNADLFERNHGGKQPVASGRITLRLASRAAEQERWDDARARLGRAMARIDRSGRVDDRILAHALLGRIAARQLGTEAALAEYGAVRRAWRQPDEAMKQLTAGGADNRRVVEVLEAVGEATFFFAERARAAADAVKRPAYRGPVAEAPLRRYVLDQIVPWVPKKRAAIERAENAYLEVLQIAPVAPPRWAIASAARAGALWAGLAEDFTSIPKLTGPIPGRGGLTYEELGAAYAAVIQSTLDELNGRAKRAFERCLALSTRYAHVDDTSRGCEQWLARYAPAEHHVFDALHEAPWRLAYRIDGRPAVPE